MPPRRRIAVGLSLLVLIISTPALTVEASASDDPAVAPVRRSACWVQHTGLPVTHVDAAMALLSTEGTFAPLREPALRVSERLARSTFAGPQRVRVATETLLEAEVPLWRMQALPAAAAGTALSLSHGDNVCLPEPLSEFYLSSSSVVRGQTAALRLETDRLAFCEIAYMGKVEPCYREGDTQLFALVGISALAEPGTYPVQVRLTTGGETTELSVPLEVEPGRYGFQFIDPPASLRALMDAELMTSEVNYLAQWGGLRSRLKLWDLPLAFPLEHKLSISADFGDRRSYGGMVSGYHSGVDYRAWTGLPVVAPADGVVVMAQTLEARGNAVLIDHGWGLVTGYWHLSRMDVEVGDWVRRGDAFARVGNTGLSTGSHLHWEVWVNGVSVDGKQWLDAECLAGAGLPPADADWVQDMVACEVEDYADE